MNNKFDIGDWITKPNYHMAYVVEDIDRFTNPIPKYYLHMVGNPNMKFWDFCIGWHKIENKENK